MNSDEEFREREGAIKTIALFVIGGSPAILTETLAAYADEGVVPDQIRITTTRKGMALLTRRFLDEGGWAAFVKEYPAYSAVPFDEGCIQVPGQLDDIGNEEENRLMMEGIFRMVREAVDSETCRIYASIAGGRKTMSYYLGLAMNLFGRASDRITHVIVPDEWEKDRSFLFPERSEVSRITLIDTPFIRLNKFLTSEIRKADIDSLINSAQTAIDMAALQPLTLNFSRREFEYLGKRGQLPPREYTFLRFFVQQKRRHCTRPEQATCNGCVDCFLDCEALSSEQKKEYLHLFRGQYGNMNDEEVTEFENTWNKFEDFKKYMPELKNKLNQGLRRPFGVDPRVERILLIKASGSGYARYGLAADKSQIRVERD